MPENKPLCPRNYPTPATREDVSASYNAVKEFGGRKYTGMRVGGSHSWYYRQGEWKETKVSPDKWQFTYEVNKRRKWDAPEGSGVPVGTEFHWYMLAHQNVRKLSANEYTTSMRGTKYKLAHRRADGEEWSASERAQLRQLITLLEENIIELRHELEEADKREKETIWGRRTQSQEPLPISTLRQQQLETY
jgi:hypothetical protein